jgi:hypothetical protein
LLETRGLTPYGLSQVSGLSERHLEDIVAGRVTRPRPKTIVQLATALNVPVEALVGDTPGRMTVVVDLPESRCDTLYALAAVERSSAERVAARVLAQYLEVHEHDGATAAIVAAIKAARDVE